MPLYKYSCSDCSQEFEVWHSMSFEGQLCDFCESSNIFKIPSLQDKKTKLHDLDSPPGRIVNDYIEEARKDLKKEKIKLKSEEL